jgi:hypothetical protein
MQKRFHRDFQVICAGVGSGTMIDEKVKENHKGLPKLVCTMEKCFEKGQREYCYDKGYQHCLLYQFLDNPLYRKKAEETLNE